MTRQDDEHPAPETPAPGDPASDQPTVVTTTAAERKEHKHFRRTRRLIARLPIPRTRKGMFAATLVMVGAGAIMTLGAVMAVGYSETPQFCGLCHTMAPEMKAYQMSAHSELACAECHVSPGIGGWLKAKVDGTKQLFEVVTRTFPEPIPAPDHEDLPPVTDTCLRCHSLESITKNGGPVRIVLRPTFSSDQANTKQMVAVVLRPVGLNDESSADTGTSDAPRGVHWHVQQTVTFTSKDPRSQTIDSVQVKNPDGTVDNYISAAVVGMTANANPDLTKLQSTEKVRTMDCLDCHNRAGHALPSTSQAVDDAMSAGTISAALPYIKRDAVELLNATYPSVEDADLAMDNLRSRYTPDVAAKQSAAITTTIATLKSLYAELATPEMKVQAQTYPDNLGHQTSAGCFRCHDGAHFKVVNGQVTDETIPSACSTCHTFPQIGSSVTGLLLGGAPASHSDKMWVFNHKDAAAAVASARNAAIKKLPTGAVDPSGTTCGTCHQRSYCEQCHSTGAVKVTHDDMLYNHANSIRVAGGAACATCHQPVFCARCHTGDVLSTPATKT